MNPPPLPSRYTNNILIMVHKESSRNKKTMCEIILKREVLDISWFKSSYCTIIKAGFISVFCPKNMFRESGADNGGGWRQSRDLHQLSAEKTWNRYQRKTGYRWRWSWREIASSNFAKDSIPSARFCVVSNSNKYFFIHHLVRDAHLTSG